MVKKQSLFITRASRERDKIVIHVDAEAPRETGSALYVTRDVSIHLPDGVRMDRLRIVAFTQTQKTGAVTSLASTSL